MDLLVLARSGHRRVRYTRRDAAGWCSENGLAYFELSHGKDTAFAQEAWQSMLQHIARACLGHAPADRTAGAEKARVPAARRGALAPR